MSKGTLILAVCATSLAMLYGAVQASESYAIAHPMDGMQLKMTYCIDMTSTKGPVADVGCKVGRGLGKVGVKRNIALQIVERLNKNKESKAYKQLVSAEGLHMTFKDESLGSQGLVTVWEDASTERGALSKRVRIVVGKES